MTCSYITDRSRNTNLISRSLNVNDKPASAKQKVAVNDGNCSSVIDMDRCQLPDIYIFLQGGIKTWWNDELPAPTSHFLVHGKKQQIQASRFWRRTQTYVRCHHPHWCASELHSFQLEAVSSSVVILLSAALELTSNDILMASFNTEEIPPRPVF